MILNSQNKIISVIIPTYNEYKNLPKLLDQLLNLETKFWKWNKDKQNKSTNKISFLIKIFIYLANSYNLRKFEWNLKLFISKV